MGALAHPVGVGPEGHMSRFGAEVAEEVALGFGVGCGTGFGGRIIFALRIFTARQADSHIGGLNSGAVGKQEIAEGEGVGDAEG